MADELPGFQVIYRGGYVPDLAICIDPTNRAYGWLLARNPLDGRLVTLCKLDANATTLFEARAALTAAQEQVERLREALRAAWIDPCESRSSAPGTPTTRT